MSEGRILAAQHEGAYVLKLVGDVRVNLCTTIDDYFSQMFDDAALISVMVDLCEAEGIDSTTLGLLAKLALRYQKTFGRKPLLYSCKPGINRLLQSMAFGKIFEIREELCEETEDVRELPAHSAEEAAVLRKVIEAHRVLMGMSAENRARFRDLMDVLEKS